MPTNTSPQSVSRRYAYNVLVRGSNKTFELDEIKQEIAKTAGGLPCGFYFVARVKRAVGFEPKFGEALSPLGAVIAALKSHGVTFR